MTDLIGLWGYGGAGKDTLAELLIAHDPLWSRVAFADAVRDVAYRINPSFGEGSTKVSLRWVVDFYGWEGAKRSVWYRDPIRELLQNVSAAVREVIGKDVWLDLAMSKIDGPTVITDIRYANDAQAVKDRGGIMVRIDQEGLRPANGHRSEVELEAFPFDLVVTNNEWHRPEGMLEQLLAFMGEPPRQHPDGVLWWSS